MLKLRDLRAVPQLALLSLPKLSEVTVSRIILAIALVAGTFLRVWQINTMGYNTDEAVYAGQGASVAGVPILKDLFPTFRAHPLLFQFMLSISYKIHFSDLIGRLLAVAVGLASIFITYQLGKTLYGRLPGVLAATFLALMPYHVVVSRQVLLDGPMMFFATLTLYMLARFGKTQRVSWLFAASAAMGLTFLSKETGIILMGSIYTFLALAPEVRVRIRDLVVASVILGLTMAPFPITLMAVSGGSSTGRNYLIWQLFRRPNHEWSFYLQVVPPAVGILVIAAAALGLVLLWKERSWREKLLLAWIFVPVAFFQLWPVKGFQYLLPIAPPLAVLAGRLLGVLAAKIRVIKIPRIRKELFLHPSITWLAVAGIVFSLGFSSWQRIQPETN